MKFTGEQFSQKLTSLADEMSQVAKAAEMEAGTALGSTQDYLDAQNLAGVCKWIERGGLRDPSFGQTEFDLPHIASQAELDRAVETIIGAFALTLLDSRRSLDDLSPRAARLIMAQASRDSVLMVLMDQRVKQVFGRPTGTMDGVPVEGISEVTVELLRFIHW